LKTALNIVGGFLAGISLVSIAIAIRLKKDGSSQSLQFAAVLAWIGGCFAALSAIMLGGAALAPDE